MHISCRSCLFLVLAAFRSPFPPLLLLYVSPPFLASLSLFHFARYPAAISDFVVEISACTPSPRAHQPRFPTLERVLALRAHARENARPAGEFQSRRINGSSLTDGRRRTKRPLYILPEAGRVFAAFGGTRTTEGSFLAKRKDSMPLRNALGEEQQPLPFCRGPSHDGGETGKARRVETTAVGLDGGESSMKFRNKNPISAGSLHIRSN